MRLSLLVAFLFVVGGTAASAAPRQRTYANNSAFIKEWLTRYPANAAAGADADFARKLSDAALAQTKEKIVYDPSYFKIAYPGGDVPAGRGVCTDVVIRAYRALNDDLQVDVHEDMAAHFADYPDLWKRGAPDTNIDHRRVPNLMVFFGRHGAAVPITKNVADYLPGDLVAWDLGGGVTHIGMVVDRRSAGGRPMIVHNIGYGPKLEDTLFDWKIIGHFRYRADLASTQ